MIEIAVASGKGGTGKTMFSVCLSLYLSKQYKVLLSDLDVEEPNCSVFINGNELISIDAVKKIPEWESETCVFCGSCSENCNFHAVINLGQHVSIFPQLCHSCYACSQLCPTCSLPMNNHVIGKIRLIDNIDYTLLEGSLDVGEEQAVPLIRQTWKYAKGLSQDFDIRIVDCPPGNSCPLVAAVENAHYVVLITEPTPFGLNDLKIAVQTMNKMKKRIGVVINRHGLGNSDVEKYCNDNNIHILGTIKYDKRIAETYALGELVYNKIGHLHQSIIDITQEIFKEYAHA
jgi:MinD superfamily P-loop ATPase